MGIWLIAARALARRLIGSAAGRVLVGGTGRRAITGAVVGTAGAGIAADLIGDDGDGGVGGGRGFLGFARRRRRRRALTQSDRNDIAFISATLGAPAGKQFAMIIASRVS